MNPPDIKCETRGDVAVATLTGEFDIGSADEMRRAITAACSESQALVLDLTATSYVDSSAIRALLTMARSFQSRGGTVVAVVPAEGIVRKVTQVSGFDSVMSVVETLDEALTMVAAP